MRNLVDNRELACPRCAKGKLVTDSNNGEMFCSICGYVVTDSIESTGPEWRSFSVEESQSKERTGMPSSLTMHDMGLSTKIDPTDRDVTGKPLSSSMKGTFGRLRKWDNRSQIHTSMDRNYVQAFGQLDRLKDKLALADAVTEKAAYIYRKAVEKGLVRGRSVSALIASCIYAACRDTETTRTLKDVARANNVKTKEISKCYRLILRELDLKMPVADPVKCITRIASNARVNEKAKRKALGILQKVQQNDGTSGKDPMGLAAAALYVACVQIGEGITQKEIAEAGGVTEVTIRNRYSAIKKVLKL